MSVLLAPQAGPQAAVAVAPPQVQRGPVQMGSRAAVAPVRRVESHLASRETTMTLFHVTDAGEAIRTAGKMLRGEKGYAGPGIYFAESVEEAKRKATSGGWVVVAGVRVGRSKAINTDGFHCHRGLLKEGYDSVRIDSLNGVEYVVYNHAQVVILAIERIP